MEVKSNVRKPFCSRRVNDRRFRTDNIVRPRNRERTEQKMNKNLRRVSVVVTAQTLYHLNRMAAMNGWAEKDIGRVIDKLVRMSRGKDDGAF